MVTPVIWQEYRIVTIKATESKIQMIFPDVGALAHHVFSTFWHRVQQKKGCFPGCLYFNGHCSSRIPQKLNTSIEKGNTNQGFDACTTDLVTTVTRVAGAAIPEGPVVGISVLAD